MKKIIHPADVTDYNNIYRKMFCKIVFEEGNLSITGVIGPKHDGNAYGGCGQIIMDFISSRKDTIIVLEENLVTETYYPKNGDSWSIKTKIRYTQDWDFKMFKKFLEIWDRWHLNDMRSACEHQRALGWTYKDHHGIWEEKFFPKPKLLIDEFDDGSDGELRPVFNQFKGEACPVCGYHIGSAWLKEKVPQDVIDFLASLPDTDVKPAWI